MSNTSERTPMFLIEDRTHDIRHVVFLDNHSECFTGVVVNLRPLIPVEKTSVDVTTCARFLIPESFFLQMSSFFFCCCCRGRWQTVFIQPRWPKSKLSKQSKVHFGHERRSAEEESLDPPQAARVSNLYFNKCVDLVLLLKDLPPRKFI